MGAPVGCLEDKRWIARYRGNAEVSVLRGRIARKPTGAEFISAYACAGVRR